MLKGSHVSCDASRTLTACGFCFHSDGVIVHVQSKPKKESKRSKASKKLSSRQQQQQQQGGAEEPEQATKAKSGKVILCMAYIPGTRYSARYVGTQANERGHLMLGIAVNC